VAAYIPALSRDRGLDQSGGDVRFKRSGNTGVRSREALVIVQRFTDGVTWCVRILVITDQRGIPRLISVVFPQ